MPKGKRKGKGGLDPSDLTVNSGNGGLSPANPRRRMNNNNNNSNSSRLRDISNDRMSVAESEGGMTHLSLDDDLDSIGTVARVSSLNDADIDEGDEAVIEGTLKDNLENATHKNSTVRLKALKAILHTLVKYYAPGVLQKYVLTVSDAAERALKKGKGEECTVGAKLIVVLAVQLGVEASESYASVRNILVTLFTDPSKPALIRSTCGQTVGLCSMLVEDEPESVEAVVEQVFGVWSGFRALVHNTDDSATLFEAAMDTWLMLILRLSQRSQIKTILREIPKVCSYLESVQMDIRIEAGETLATLYEIGRQFEGENFKPANHQKSIETLETLSRDSLKHRAKRDRRVQRSTFRQVYSYIAKDEDPAWKIKFDAETMELSYWQEKLMYNGLCDLLGGGMNFHLKSNYYIRDLFDLGPPDVDQLSKAQAKLNKSETQAVHAFNQKSRKMMRGRQRDRKAAAFD